MDYAAFSDYLASFLWKSNDADLVANMDNLIVMGTSKLNRVLDIKERDMEVVLSVTEENVVLPNDFKQVISVSQIAPNSRITAMANVTLTALYQARQAAVGAMAPVYSITKPDQVNTIMFAGPMTVANPTNVQLWYRANLPDYKATDASWMADNYLDVYVYTVLAQTAPFLREDERLAMWIELSENGITEMLEEDRFNGAFGGSPLEMRMSRPAP